MPSAAFVAGAAVQNAHNASLIAQQAATVAEQQTLEANQARRYASFVEAQATQALQQAEATLLETRAKAEAYVAQAEANVRNTQQQAQAFAASVDQEREQFQAQLNSRAQQWARGVEADARLRVQQLQHHTEQYMSAQQDTVRNLQQHNAVLEQQLLAERSPVPNSPKSPMTQISTGSQLSTPVMAYGKDPSEGNPFTVSMQLEPPSGLLPQDAQPSLPLTPKGSHRPQEYYIGSVRGTPPGSVAPADGHAGQVASLEAQVSSLQDTVKLLAGHLQSLLNAPKTMTPVVMSPGPTIGVPVPPPPPPPAMLMPPPPPPLPPHAAAPVPGTAAVALMSGTCGVTGISNSYLADIPAYAFCRPHTQCSSEPNTEMSRRAHHPPQVQVMKATARPATRVGLTLPRLSTQPKAWIPQSRSQTSHTRKA